MKFPSWAVTVMFFFGFFVVIVGLAEDDSMTTVFGGYILLKYTLQLATHTLQEEVSRHINPGQKESSE